MIRKRHWRDENVDLCGDCREIVNVEKTIENLRKINVFQGFPRLFMGVFECFLRLFEGFSEFFEMLLDVSKV